MLFHTAAIARLNVICDPASVKQKYASRPPIFAAAFLQRRDRTSQSASLCLEGMVVVVLSIAAVDTMIVVAVVVVAVVVAVVVVSVVVVVVVVLVPDPVLALVVVVVVCWS